MNLKNNNANNKWLPFSVKHSGKTKAGCLVALVASAGVGIVGTYFNDRQPFDAAWDAFYAANTQDQEYREMKVIEGDTVWGIAKLAEVPAARRDVYEQQFKEANNIGPDEQILLVPGQAYKFPNPYDAL